jgi:hypothetical protein
LTMDRSNLIHLLRALYPLQIVAPQPSHKQEPCAARMVALDTQEAEKNRAEHICALRFPISPGFK